MSLLNWRIGGSNS